MDINNSIMKRSYFNWKTLLAVLFTAGSFMTVTAQNFNNETLTAFSKWPRYAVIKECYTLNGFKYLWLERKALQEDLVGLLDQSQYFGLERNDYHHPYITKLKTGELLKDQRDSVEADISMTDAALHFISDLGAGNQTPSFRYMGLAYKPVVNDLPAKLLKALTESSLRKLAAAVQPRSKEYYAILARLTWFVDLTTEKGFADVRITSSAVSKENIGLLKRLYQLRITDSVIYNISDKELLQKLKEAVNEFDVLNDGKLRSTTLAAMNIPLKSRVRELNIAINYFRWFDHIRETSSVLILNIPSAGFTVYEEGKILLESKAIVGKRNTPTPLLTSTITETIIYPYWMVPYKIATRELLPAIKRNIGYLEANNYQVVNKQGKVVNPYSINWHALSTGYFPYTIRQSTGCDNALGIVKFNFYNPFTVYLHDTPGKSLFTLNKRYFSHGCMRVEKPIELAHILLGWNSIAIDTITAKGCLNKKAPVAVPVEKKLSLMVIYSTAWCNKEGAIKFYDDIYNRL
jgi:L,D-transpeptidase YcbB